MPKIIRRALYEKFAALPDWQRFREDFLSVSGLAVDMLDQDGDEHTDSDGGPLTVPELCRRILQTEAGCGQCRKFRIKLAARAKDGPVRLSCESGMSVVLVPLQVSGIRIGYLRFRCAIPPAAAPKAGKESRGATSNRVNGAGAATRKLLASVPQLTAAQADAWARMLEMAAQHLTEQTGHHLSHESELLPPIVQRVCNELHEQAFAGDVQLEDMARSCSVSPGHLSRLFHRSTGLTFRDYVARLRAERAFSLMRESRKTITEIAFESGFGSISQFHRTFRKIYNASPGELRQRIGPAS